MSLGNRYSQHSFAQVPAVHNARSQFDRSSAAKTTFDFDDLVPVFVEEIIPGDTMRLNVRSFCRLAPQVKPLLDNMYLKWYFFFVPNRLTWANWERFNGAQDNPGDSTSYIIPVLDSTGNPVFAGGPNFNCRVYNVDATGNTALPTSTRPADIAPCAQVRF